jgi:hypothetical protein
MNMTEYQSSDENIPARISEDEKKSVRHYIDHIPLWDIKSPVRPFCEDYSFMSYDSEGKPRRYLTHSAHQSRPYSLEDGDSIDIGYMDIKTYLDGGD